MKLNLLDVFKNSSSFLAPVIAGLWALISWNNLYNKNKRREIFNTLWVLRAKWDESDNNNSDMLLKQAFEQIPIFYKSKSNVYKLYISLSKQKPILKEDLKDLLSVMAPEFDLLKETIESNFYNSLY